MKRLLGILLFSLRLSAKVPMNTLLCIAVLAGGIALATTTYKIYELVFSSAVPYKDSERLVVPQRVFKNNNQDTGWPIQSYKMLRERQQVFESITPFVTDGMSLKHNEQGQLVLALYVEEGFTSLADVHPFIGREITASDCRPDSPKVAIISYETWRDLYQSDPNVVGQTIVGDGIVREIIGVMPEGFDGPFPINRVAIWVPLNPDTILKDTGYVTEIGMACIVKKGLSREEAASRINSVTREIAAAYAQENDGVEYASLRYLNDAHTNEDGTKILSAVFVCGFLILFMSCGIVSGLLTARYSTRTQEIAIRSALGASRFQIVGQMIVEFLTISIPAVILGFLLSHWFDVAVINGFLDRFQIPDFMRHQNTTRMVVFILIVLCFVSLVSTLMPALRASRTDLNGILHESTRTGSSLRITRMSNFLITWQVATACIVLTGGAVVGYFIYDYRTFNRTFNPEDYLSARIAFNAHDHTSKTRNNEVNTILSRLRQDPGVVKACVSNEFFHGNQACGGEKRVWEEGKDYASEMDAPIEYNRVVSPGYFDAMNIPILAGRDFTPEDDTDHPVAIVTEGFAMERYGTTDVLGRRFRISRDGAFMTIVGLVPEVYNPKHDPALHSGFFRPYGLEPWDDVFILIKSRSSFEDTRRLVTSVVESTDTRICLSLFQTFNDARGQQGPETFLEFLLALFITFAICALVMTAGGLYGIISFSTNMRRTEMGIRLALGARPSGLVLLMTRRGMVFVLIGLILGVAGSMLLRNIMMSTFSGSSDAMWTYFVCGMILVTISGVSIFIPAYAAANCDPARALRD